MPQIPVNLESATQSLREETPSPHAAAKIRRALDARPTRTPRYAFALATVLAGTIAATALWPHEVRASWLQSIEITKNATTVHRVEMDGDRTMYELWQQGAKRAFYVRDRQGRLITEQRSDGKRMFNYFNFYRGEQKKLPNAFEAGRLIDVNPKWDAYARGDTLIDQLLKQQWLKEVSHFEVDTADGKRIRYDLKMKDRRDPSGDQHLTVDVEPETGRIRKAVNGNTVSTISYPESIPASVFQPRPHLAQGVVTVDANQVKRDAAKRIARGLGTKNGVTLRLVAMDCGGALWAVWSGYLPDGKLSRPFELIGVPCGPAYGLKALTASYKQDKLARVSPVVGLKLGGMSRGPKVKIGDTVDIKVPAPKGYAEFRHVPVMRIYDIRDVEQEIGFGPR